MAENKQTNSHRWREVLDTTATFATIALCATVIWALVARPSARPAAPAATKRPAPLPLPTEPISTQGAVTLGNRQARLVVIEYTEFKCPYCGRFANETFPMLKQKFVDSGRVLFVFRHFPLDKLHPFARQAARSAECAGRQDKFWQLHDLMFANQAVLAAEPLLGYLKTLAVDLKSFDACMNGSSAERIQEDVRSGELLGVTGTPTFFIGVRQPDGRVKLVEQMTGAQKLSVFEGAFERWLNEADKADKE